MYNHQEVRSFIQGQNSAHQVVVWSKSDSPYCVATKKLFRSLPGRDIVFHELDTMPQCDLIEQELATITGRRTFPVIFVINKLLGGYEDLKKAQSSGKLRILLNTLSTSSSLRALALIKESRSAASENISQQRNFIWSKQPPSSSSLKSNNLLRSISALRDVKLQAHHLNHGPLRHEVNHDLTGKISNAPAMSNDRLAGHKDHGINDLLKRCCREPVASNPFKTSLPESTTAHSSLLRRTVSPASTSASLV